MCLYPRVGEEHTRAIEFVKNSDVSRTGDCLNMGARSSKLKTSHFRAAKCTWPPVLNQHDVVV